ncbi:MAG: AraC family transcriptional regulator [Bacteroidales bacterium]|nr:AraC family transcriptional regulator [Bacteroidales bacterium]
MTINEQSRKEYMARIYRVMNFVESHIDQVLTLDVLAAVACFSPYHFHRIFQVLVGETPANFVQRIRVEKAARLLRNEPKMSISEIAFACGFGSVSLFSRSFRAHFGTTAKEFRLREVHVYLSRGLRYSKNGQLLSKIVKRDFDFDTHLCSVKLKNLIFMESKIEIKEMPEMRVAYVRHRGEYEKIGKAYETLMKWAGPRGLYRFPETKTLTIYQDDPSITELENVRQDACITLAEDVPVEGEIGKAIIPAQKCAVGRFQIGFDGFEKAWNTVWLWVTENGYLPAGSAYELYHNSVEDSMHGRFDMEVCIPVKAM